MALKIPLKYTHSTTRFRCFEYIDHELIFKVYVPHTEKANGYWVKCPDPTTMDIEFEFDEIPVKEKH